MRRRDFVRRAAGGLAVLGGGLVADAAAADPLDGNGAGHVGTVWTRGHFEITWQWNVWTGGVRTVELAGGHSRYDYERRGEIPWGADELAVVAHGWLADHELAERTYHTAAAGLRNEHYDVPVVGFEWDADTGVIDWGPGRTIATRNGYKLASFLRDLTLVNPDATIRLMGHSLGARIALVALREFERIGATDVVESLDLFGAAVDDETVRTGGEFGSAIRTVARRADNYYSGNDGILKYAYSPARFDTAVGLDGAGGAVPTNYEDHDVTDRVPGHVDYFLPDDPDQGCGPLVVEEWTA